MHTAASHVEVGRDSTLSWAVGGRHYLRWQCSLAGRSFQSWTTPILLPVGGSGTTRPEHGICLLILIRVPTPIPWVLSAFQ
jgi:hypothetical protein